MSTPLNLTLKRGPSVWDEPTGGSIGVDWRALGVVAGAVLAATALGSRANRQWVMGLGLGIAGASLLGGRFTSTLEAGARKLRSAGGRRNDQAVDRASEDSFPASDPPQYR